MWQAEYTPYGTAHNNTWDGSQAFGQAMHLDFGYVAKNTFEHFYDPTQARESRPDTRACGPLFGELASYLSSGLRT